MTRGEGWVRDVVLMVTDSEIVMKEDSTQVRVGMVTVYEYFKTNILHKQTNILHKYFI